jgi:hypothetical protein
LVAWRQQLMALDELGGEGAVGPGASSIRIVFED